MTELRASSIQASVSGAGCFTFYNNNIVTVSEEGYIKYFEVNDKAEEGSKDALKLTRNVPVAKHVSTIASNGVDVITYSGSNKIVQTVFKEKFDKPNKVTETASPVHRLLYPNKKLILICSEANDMQIYWIEIEKVMKLTPFHDGTVLYGDVDKSCEFIATTGCDGNLHICKLNTDINKVELVLD